MTSVDAGRPDHVLTTAPPVPGTEAGTWPVPQLHGGPGHCHPDCRHTQWYNTGTGHGEHCDI